MCGAVGGYGGGGGSNVSRCYKATGTVAGMMRMVVGVIISDECIRKL